MTTLTVDPELMELLPGGTPKVSLYTEFLRITKTPDTADNFVAWSRVAVLLMRQPDGHA